MSVWNYPRVFVADIIAEVSQVFGVPEDVIKGPSRTRAHVMPRFACAYLARNLTALSYPMIGRSIGGRDHSSIIHGKDMAELHMARDPEYRAYVDSVRIRLLGTRQRVEQRRREVLAVARERLRRDQIEADRIAREEAAAAEALIERNDMDELSIAVAAFTARGGSFVEVHA